MMINTREVGRTRDKRRKPRREAEWFPAYRVERKTVFTYAHVKWFYSQSERAYYLNYFIVPYIKGALTLQPKRNETEA